MSDCSNSRCAPYPALRLRVEFAGEEHHWEYPIALNGRTVAGVFLDGERWVPEGRASRDAAMGELKPCPFCGGEAKMRRYPHCTIVRCENDGCAVKPTCSMEHDDADHSRDGELIAAWNARAREAELEALVRDMWEFVPKANRLQWPELRGRMAELGLGAGHDCG